MVNVFKVEYEYNFVLNEGWRPKKKNRQKPQEKKVRQKYPDDFVSRAVKLVMASIAGRKPAISSHFFCGPSINHPRHAVIWYLFRTDTEWQTAKSNGLVSDLEQLTSAALTAGGYRTMDAVQVMVDSTSDEDVQRKTGGNHRTYFRMAKKFKIERKRTTRTN